MTIIDKDKELKNVSFVKTILMLIIVFYHSIIFMNGIWFEIVDVEVLSKWPVYIIDWLNSFHIYAFTLASGYLFFYIKYERKGYSCFIQFINNKVKRLLIPYLFVSIAWVIPIYCYFYKPDMNILVQKYALGENPNQLWFLLMLFWVFLISWPLSNILCKKWAFIIPIIFFGIAKIGAHFLPNYFQIWTALRYFLFFFLGFKIRQCWRNFINRIPWVVYVVIDIVLFATVLATNDQTGTVWSVLNIGLNLGLNIIGALMAWRGLQVLASDVNWEESKVIAFLSKRSMIVYLFHQQIIYFVIYYLIGIITLQCLVVVNFIVGLSFSLIIATVLLKNSITSFLIGEKTQR